MAPKDSLERRACGIIIGIIHLLTNINDRYTG